jgi:two-component system sensor histidine kinase HydH
MSRAIVTLITSLAAALILGVAAVVFWRLSTKADTIAAQLAGDEQLKTLGQMSAVLGHELRNPIASLKGHAQLLLRKTPPEQSGRKNVETVVREVQRLEDLTDQVLAFAKTGKFDISPIDPADLIRTAIEKSGVAAVSLSLDGEIGPWPLDGSKMEMVIVNLVVNARQASSESDPVAISCRVENGLLQIEVRDRGAGITPGDEERVFEPFFTKQVKGTGLGLSLARRIVEGHGGTITAAAHPKRGAVFRITMPPAKES